MNSEITIKVETNDSKATYEIKNNSSLSIGENKINIEVTAEDGSTKTYNLIVNREKELSSDTGIEVFINGEKVSFDNQKNASIGTTDTSIDFNYNYIDFSNNSENTKAYLNEWKKEIDVYGEDSYYKGKKYITRKTILNYAKTVIRFHDTFLLGNPVSLSCQDSETLKTFNDIYKLGQYETVDYQIIDRVNKFDANFNFK